MTTVSLKAPYLFSRWDTLPPVHTCTESTPVPSFHLVLVPALSHTEHLLKNGHGVFALFYVTAFSIRHSDLLSDMFSGCTFMKIHIFITLFPLRIFVCAGAETFWYDSSRARLHSNRNSLVKCYNNMTLQEMALMHALMLGENTVFCLQCVIIPSSHRLGYIILWISQYNQIYRPSSILKSLVFS